MATSAAIKEEAKARAHEVFKPKEPENAEDGLGPRRRAEPAVYNEANPTTLSDEELIKRFEVLHAEVKARSVDTAKAKREKTRVTLINLLHELNDVGELESWFVKRLSKSGKFSPKEILSNEFSDLWVSEHFRSVIGEAEKKTKERKKSERSYRSLPEHNESGETPRDAIVRIVNAAKGKEITADEITSQLALDPIFGEFMKRYPRAFGTAIYWAARAKAIEFLGDGKYRAFIGKPETPGNDPEAK